METYFEEYPSVDSGNEFGKVMYVRAMQNEKQPK